jgi:tetratricopeptide (TPR) repeat protein
MSSPNPSSPSVTTHDRVFISYSHRGNGPDWKARLLRPLGVFEQHHLLDVWQDGKIRISSYWDDDIQQAMSDARLAVVLLTPEALESEYILKKEFPLLRERQQRDKLPVIPVICEECDWRAQDWLRATQAPNKSNPLSQLTEAAQESVFRQLATTIAGELSRVFLAELPKPVQPLSPDRVYLERFPLPASGLREEKLIGREQELALLDLAYAQPSTAIVSLVAWGGVGKTMLVQHWLQRLQREGWFGTQRVYAWSFYSQGTKEDRQASEDLFLAHALKWFGVECEPTVSPWEKGRLLAEAVLRERTFLIFDGIEPLQYPPGPMGGQLRAPGVQSLLKQLARKVNDTENRGLCLVTTREPLIDLADFQRRPGSAWGSVLRVDLGNLTEEAGAALLHHAGANRAGAAEIKPGDAELLAASREVAGHALTLNLLGRFLARAYGGDIRRRDLVKFEEADRKEQGGTTFKMLAAFENWFARSGEFGARQLAVLRMLGLFDRPADAGCIGALREPPIIAGLTEPLFTSRLDEKTGEPTLQPLLKEDWNTATAFLADFGLVTLQEDAANNERLLDCHPLIREYFSKQLRGHHLQSWIVANRRLYTFVKSNTELMPDSVTGLQPLYQAVAYGCRAGLYQESCDEVFFNRIKRGQQESYVHFSTQQLGLFSDDLSAISHFFTTPWARVVNIDKSDQVWLLNQAAFYLMALGRFAEALEPALKSVAGSVKQRDWMEATIATTNLSSIALILGNLATALFNARRALSYAKKHGSAEEISTQRAHCAWVLHQLGKNDQARSEYHESETLLLNVYGEPVFEPVSRFRYCDMVLEESHSVLLKTLLASNAVQSSSSDARKTSSGWQLNQDYGQCIRSLKWAEKAATEILRNAKKPLYAGLGHLILGRIALYHTFLTENAEVHFTEASSALSAALDELRRAGQLTEILNGLFARLLLLFIQGDLVGARSDLDEAWDVAERGPMRLHMADIHLYRARLFFREKYYPWKSSQEDLAAVEKLINECGYHRRDEELADAKRAILGIGTQLHS